MKNTILAQRYAKALFELSIEMNKLEEVKKDMALMLETITESKEFKQFLVSPVIQDEKKTKILVMIFTGKVEALTLKLFELLAKNRRESDLKIIAEEFIHQYKVYKNITTVNLKTAVRIGEPSKAEILSRLTKYANGTIDLIEEVDQKLIGGCIVSIENEQYDAPLLRVFNQLKKEFEENLYIRGI